MGGVAVDSNWAWPPHTHTHTHTHTHAHAHVQVGYPLATTLVCLLDNEQYATAVDTTADFLIRCMTVI